MFKKLKQDKFDFCLFIVNELGYTQDLEFANCKSFIKDNFSITVYFTKKIKGYDMVSMDLRAENLFNLKFIPLSSVVTESLIGQSEKLYVSEEEL